MSVSVDTGIWQGSYALNETCSLYQDLRYPLVIFVLLKDIGHFYTWNFPCVTRLGKSSLPDYDRCQDHDLP